MAGPDCEGTNGNGVADAVVDAEADAAPAVGDTVGGCKVEEVVDGDCKPVPEVETSIGDGSGVVDGNAVAGSTGVDADVAEGDAYIFFKK